MLRKQRKYAAPSCVTMLILWLCVAVPVSAQVSSARPVTPDDVAAKVHAYDVRLGLRPSFESCMNTSDGVTSSMIDCDREEYVFQDKRLNRVYHLLMAKLSAQDKVPLRDQERAWIKYRDTHCDTHETGGTADDVMRHGCLMEQTAMRATELEGRLKSGK